MHIHRGTSTLNTARRHRGIVMVMTVFAMLGLLAMEGLALDGGHMLLNKTRLQNAVDAAALTAAKTLTMTGDTLQATAAATGIIAGNLADNGNEELGNAVSSGAVPVTVQFSSTLSPFAPGTAPELYVRVRVANVPLNTFLLGVVGFDKFVTASAVSGPSVGSAIGAGAPTCDIAPMMVCGDSSQHNPEADPPQIYGYTLGEVQVLKTSSSSASDWEVGPGNFQLIRLGSGQGGADVREGMAGGYTGCVSGDAGIQTEPGNTVGPVVQGLNTRFGQYSGPISAGDYPPDVITTENTLPITPGVTTAADLNYDHQMYLADLAAERYDYAPVEDGGTGVFGRRVLAVPIGDCTGTTSGQGSVPLLGYGCFFLLQTVAQKGNESEVYGQFIENCSAEIIPGPSPVPPTTSTLYEIILYDDANSRDS